MSCRPVGVGRWVTPVERDGARIAGIIHDASLAEDSELVDAMGYAAALALENERLNAELHAQLEGAARVAGAAGRRGRGRAPAHRARPARRRAAAAGVAGADAAAGRNEVDGDPEGAVEVLAAARERARRWPSCAS